MNVPLDSLEYPPPTHTGGDGEGLPGRGQQGHQGLPEVQCHPALHGIQLASSHQHTSLIRLPNTIIILQVPHKKKNLCCSTVTSISYNAIAAQITLELAESVAYLKLHCGCKYSNRRKSRVMVLFLLTKLLPETGYLNLLLTVTRDAS